VAEHRTRMLRSEVSMARRSAHPSTGVKFGERSQRAKGTVVEGERLSNANSAQSRASESIFIARSSPCARSRQSSGCDSLLEARLLFAAATQQRLLAQPFAQAANCMRRVRW
jgi:hypothetical protein